MLHDNGYAHVKYNVYNNIFEMFLFDQFYSIYMNNQKYSLE